MLPIVGGFQIVTTNIAGQAVTFSLKLINFNQFFCQNSCMEVRLWGCDHPHCPALDPLQLPIKVLCSLYHFVEIPASEPQESGSCRLARPRLSRYHCGRVWRKRTKNRRQKLVYSVVGEHEQLECTGEPFANMESRWETFSQNHHEFTAVLSKNVISWKVTYQISSM